MPLLRIPLCWFTPVEGGSISLEKECRVLVRTR
nr:MAG TPA_asm: hypothetical protein [Caudoviricetes sp.]